MKCSFCEQPLVCKSCGQPFRPNQSETHLGAYQPDMEIACPECQHVLTCKMCGYVYGEDQEEDNA
jgi:rubredoxin